VHTFPPVHLNKDERLTGLEVANMDARWTVRNISPEARTLIDEIHAATGIPYGRLLSLAIQHWHSRLPQEGLLLGVMSQARSGQVIKMPD